MLNQTVLVGRLVNQPKMEGDSCTITLAIPRSYKNEDGEYETDFINAKVWKAVATNVCEYCKKGDLIGVRGRIETTDGNMQIIADKITFLKSGKED